MRPIESLLLCADMLAFLIVAIPQLRVRRWMGAVVFITFLLAPVQILVEGPRWQLVPAYILTAIFLLAWLLQNMVPITVRVKRIITSRIVVGIALIVSILGSGLSAALPIALPVFHFPHPDGPYAIGTITYHWIDRGRPELFTTNPNDSRELMAQVWYPAKDEPAAPRASYIEDADVVTPALARAIHLPGFFFTHFRYVTTNAVVSAPVADNQARYPVLIFLSGVEGFRETNTFQVEELVSHGYIVVGLDQPGASALVRFPDGRQIVGWLRDDIQPLIMQSIAPEPKAPSVYGKAMPEGIIPYLAQDASFALDQLTAMNRANPKTILTGHLDLAHAGIFGISLGSINAGEACAKDSRLKACLLMDAAMPADVVKAGLHQPAVFITRDANTMRLERSRIGGWTERDIALTLNTMRDVYERMPEDAYYIQIPKMFHLNFTDAPYWSPLTSQAGLTGPIDGQRGFDIVNAYSLAFLDKYLKGQPEALLTGPSKQYPEAIFEAR